MTLRELAPPPGAYHGGAEEVMRVWFAGGGLATVIGRIDDPVRAGIMLADLSRHASRIFSEINGEPAAVALQKIIRTFDEVQQQRSVQRIGDVGAALRASPGQPFAELPVPPQAKSDPNGGEVVRLWLARGGIEAVLVGIWDQPDNWGILLTDIGLQMADAIAGGDKAQTEIALGAIHKALRREWQASTDPGRTKPLARH